MNKVKFIFLIGFIGFIIQACKQGKSNIVVSDTADSGTATFVADESFKPIVDQEMDIFKHDNAKADPQILYRPESNALRLLLDDSVQLAILSRDLTADEKIGFTAKKLTPIVNRFAIDAIALIVNQASKDTLITVGELKQMLAGQSKNQRNIVFDNANSSLARYLKAFSGVNNINQKGIYALKNNKEVIKFVSENVNAIGITGLSWLNNPDKDYEDAVNKVKVMSVRDEQSKTNPDKYFTPSQTTLMLKQYPLIRGLYVINCTGKMGLGANFAHFLLSDRGQRIILLSNILPDEIPEREIKITHK